MSFKYFREPFESALEVFRLEPNHSGRVFHTVTEVHPQTVNGVYEKRVDNGPRSVSA